MVKDYMALNNTQQIKKLLKVLGQDFALSQNPNSRKGGLIGLAAISIALGKVSPKSCYFNQFFVLIILLQLRVIVRMSIPDVK